MARDAVLGSELTPLSSCPVCESRARDPWVHFDALHFDRCSGCGTVYRSFELPSVQTSGLYEAPYHTGKRSRRWAHRVRKAKNQIRSAMHFGDCRSILDVGCSVGYIVEAGSQLKLRSAGMDVSEFAVKTVKERGLDARVGTLERMPFEAGEFDLVMMRHVLEHTPTPIEALQEVRRVLSPRGLVMLMVPDLSYWKGQWLRRTYRYFRPDDLGRQHFVYYHQASMTRLLRDQGFEILARGKGHYRSIENQSGVARIGSAILDAVFRGVFSFASLVRMRRELYFIARKCELPAPASTEPS